MSRTIERVVYTGDCNAEGDGVCKVMFMLDMREIKCCCHGRHIGKRDVSAEVTIPASAEVSHEDRMGLVSLMGDYTGKDTLADWAEFTIQVDECVDAMVEMGWCLPCME